MKSYTNECRPENTDLRERLGTVDLHNKITCFVTEVKNIFNTKATDLS
jgi:hypothetical protein